MTMTKQPQMTLQSVLINPGARSFSATVSQFQQSKSYKGLIQTLDREISEELQQAKKNEVPKIKGFEVKSEGAKITLTKTYVDEKIKVEFNVNDSLGRYGHGDEEEFENNKPEKPQAEQHEPDFRSRPPFSVTITRGNKNLSLHCEFMESGSEDVQENEDVDDFDIINFAIHENELNETVYAADCQYIDSGLYDNLLDILDERGIGQDFAKELAEFASAYESRQYIDLLEKLKSFAK